MIQEIITYIIISAAVVYTLYSFIRTLIPSKNNSGHSCCSGCSGCAVKTLTSTKIIISEYNELKKT